MYKRIKSTFLPTRNSKGCPFHLLRRVLPAKLCSAIRTHTSAQAQVRAGAADPRTDIRDDRLTGRLEFKVEFSSNKEGDKGHQRGSKSVVPPRIHCSSINAYRALIYPCAVMTVNQSSANKSSGLLGQGGVNNKHRSHLSSLSCLYL